MSKSLFDGRLGQRDGFVLVGDVLGWRRIEWKVLREEGDKKGFEECLVEEEKALAEGVKLCLDNRKCVATANGKAKKCLVLTRGKSHTKGIETICEDLSQE